MAGYRNDYFTVMLTAEKRRINGGRKDTIRGKRWNHYRWRRVDARQSAADATVCFCKECRENKPVRWRRHTAKSCFHIYKHP